jgi:hypothetical protein
LIEYANVPPLIGTLVSSGKATLVELQTILSCQDAYDILEILAVDNYNDELRAKERRS